MLLTHWHSLGVSSRALVSLWVLIVLRTGSVGRCYVDSPETQDSHGALRIHALGGDCAFFAGFLSLKGTHTSLPH